MPFISFLSYHGCVQTRVLKAFALLILVISSPMGFSHARVSERRLNMLNDFDNFLN